MKIHTQKYWCSPWSSLSESRRVFLDRPGQEEVLETVEATGGKTTMDPLAGLESDTKVLVERVATMKATLWERINHFGSKESAMAAKLENVLLEEARHQIRTETDLATSKLGKIFRRGKRHLEVSVERIMVKQIAADMQRYLQVEHQKSLERNAETANLAKRLKLRKGPILLQADRDREKLLKAIAMVSGKYDERIGARGEENAGIPQEWVEMQESEDALKSQLVMHDVVPAELVEQMFEDHCAPSVSRPVSYFIDTPLEKRVKTAMTLVGEPALQKVLLNSLKKFRRLRGHRTWYKSLHLTQPDVNVGTLEERLAALQGTRNMVGKELLVTLDGITPVSTRIVNQDKDRNVVVIKNTASGKYLILDTDQKVVCRKRADGTVQDVPLTEDSFHLST
ncbi:MAG: hypothetical protein V1926_06460 [Candidatus Peregrinibacteria bacterium]